MGQLIFGSVLGDGTKLQMGLRDVASKLFRDNSHPTSLKRHAVELKATELPYVLQGVAGVK